MVKGYSSAIEVDRDTGASLAYFDDDKIMELTITDYLQKKSKSFYRQGEDEKDMRLNLLQISGVVKLIEENKKQIREILKNKPLWKSNGFRNLWGLTE